jgi:hypothetical protein
MAEMKKKGTIRCIWDNTIKNHYVYAHYTADTNQLFYIGIGSHRPGETVGRKYLRAYSCAVSQRNFLWIAKYNKHGRTVSILFDNLTEKEAKEKEIELIAQYGTCINKTGTLCNISGGGEGRYQDDSMCKKIYVYNLQGTLINEFNSCQEAADFYGLEQSNVGSAARMKRKTCGDYQFRYEYNKDKDILYLEKTTRRVAKPIKCTNVKTGEVKYFSSAYKFRLFIGAKSNAHIDDILHGRGGRKIVKGWRVDYAAA